MNDKHMLNRDDEQTVKQYRLMTTLQLHYLMMNKWGWGEVQFEAMQCQGQPSQLVQIGTV